MKTKELVIPGLGTIVLVHHADDWSGWTTIEWHDGTNFHRVSLPMIILEQVTAIARKSKNTRSRHERDRDRARKLKR